MICYYPSTSNKPKYAQRTIFFQPLILLVECRVVPGELLFWLKKKKRNPTGKCLLNLVCELLSALLCCFLPFFLPSILVLSLSWAQIHKHKHIKTANIWNSCFVDQWERLFELFLVKPSQLVNLLTQRDINNQYTILWVFCCQLFDITLTQPYPCR